MNRLQSKENRGKLRRYSLKNNHALRLSRKYWISSFIIYLITHFHLNYPRPVSVWPRSSVGTVTEILKVAGSIHIEIPKFFFTSFGSPSVPCYAYL